jgi:hypothetical protein
MTINELTDLRTDLIALRTVAQRELDQGAQWMRITPSLALRLLKMCDSLLESLVKDCLISRIHVPALDATSPTVDRTKDTR